MCCREPHTLDIRCVRFLNHFLIKGWWIVFYHCSNPGPDRTEGGRSTPESRWRFNSENAPKRYSINSSKLHRHIVLRTQTKMTMCLCIAIHYVLQNQYLQYGPETAVFNLVAATLFCTCLPLAKNPGLQKLTVLLLTKNKWFSQYDLNPVQARIDCKGKVTHCELREIGDWICLLILFYLFIICIPPQLITFTSSSWCEIVVEIVKIIYKLLHCIYSLQCGTRMEETQLLYFTFQASVPTFRQLIFSCAYELVSNAHLFPQHSLFIWGASSYILHT